MTLKPYQGQACCILIQIIALLLIWPIAELSIGDDWSYTKIALDFANTGEIHYNAWGAPMLGVQVWWGAGFIRLFGFSFLTVRMSGIVAALAVGIVLYQLLIFYGLSSWDAVIGTLALTCSPIFLPRTCTFMSDVPALLLIVLFISCTAKAVNAQSIVMTALAAICGLAAGSIRQPYWLLPLIILPTIAILYRGHIAFAIAVTVFWIAMLLAIGMLCMWFVRQPYALVEYPLDIRSIPTKLPTGTTWRFITCICKTSLFLLPVTVLRWRTIVDAIRNHWRLFLATIFAILFIEWTMPQDGSERWFPWMAEITQFGFFASNEILIGTRPVIVSPMLCIFLSLLAVIIVGALVSAFVDNRRHINNMQLLIVAISLYSVFLIIRAGGNDLNDRYLLLPVALGGILIMRLPKHSERLSRLGIWMVAIFAVCGIAITHDFFALARARCTAANLLMSQGIKRTQICAGIEFDGWTQLITRGHVQSKAVPISEHIPMPSRSHLPLFWFYVAIPDVRPTYIISSSRLDMPLVATVPYSNWLPPQTSAVFIQAVATDNHGPTKGAR